VIAPARALAAVDKLHFLASGDADEYCFCFISRP